MMVTIPVRAVKLPAKAQYISSYASGPVEFALIIHMMKPRRDKVMPIASVRSLLMRVVGFKKV